MHESAYIDEGAQVGGGTKIWHFSHDGGSHHRESCSLGQNVMVASNVRIRNKCKIQNNVSVYEGVVLEDYIFCGPGAVFTNVLTPRSMTSSRNTRVDHLTTLVKRGASIGANACTIVCGVTLQYAFRCGWRGSHQGCSRVRYRRRSACQDHRLDECLR